MVIIRLCWLSFASPLPTVWCFSSSSFTPICCSSLPLALPHLILSTSTNPLLVQAPRERFCLIPISLLRTGQVFHHAVKQSKWTSKWKIWMKLPNRLSKISASASIRHPPVSDRMLSKSKLQTSSPAAAKARFNQPRSIHLSQHHIQTPSVRDIPLTPQESKPPDAKTIQSTRKSPINSTKPHLQVPATHVASVSLGSLYSVGTPDPVSLCKKRRMFPFRLYQIPPIQSNPFRLSLLWSQCIDRRSLGSHMLWGCLSAKRCGGRQCAGVSSSSRHRRGYFTPSRAAAASRQWLMPSVAARGTFASPAPRRIRPSGILPSLRCWRTPSRRGGV